MRTRTARRRLIVALAVLGALHLAAIAAPLIAPYPYDAQHRDDAWRPPDRTFPLGTDGFGRDLLSRMLYGARISLFAGLAAAAVALGLGALLGTVSGLYGGRVDALLMRLNELFMALPWLYLLLGVRAFLPLELPAGSAFAILVALIGLVGWAGPARLVRGVVLSAREREYVLAARGFGAGNVYLVRRHLLPEVGELLLTQAALLVPRYILAEVTLSFLGLGIDEPVPSWGTLLGELQQVYVLDRYWWMLAPAAALVAVVFAYHAVARALTDARLGRLQHLESRAP